MGLCLFEFLFFIHVRDNFPGDADDVVTFLEALVPVLFDLL